MTEETNTITDADIKGLFDSMLSKGNQKQAKVFQAIAANSQLVQNITDHDELHTRLLFPFEEFTRALIKAKFSQNPDVVFIIQNHKFIERHFRFIIERFEGYRFCADKTYNIILSLIEYYKTGEQIVFDYDGEVTYHLPKKVFTHDSIIEFYKGVEGLFWGRSDKYLAALKNLLDSVKPEKTQEERYELGEWIQVGEGGMEIEEKYEVWTQEGGHHLAMWIDNSFKPSWDRYWIADTQENGKYTVKGVTHYKKLGSGPTLKS